MLDFGSKSTEEHIPKYKLLFSMIKVSLKNNCLSMQSVWAGLCLIADIVFFMTMEIFLSYDQFGFKMTRSSIFKSSMTLTRFVKEDLYTLSMIHNIAEYKMVCSF